MTNTKTRIPISPSGPGAASLAVSKAELEQFFANIAQSPSRGTVTCSELGLFFTTVGRLVDLAEKRQREIDKRLATGFNVLRLIEPDENKLSDLVKNLLDPKGTHGQGDVFLRLLLDQLGLGDHAASADKAVVEREAWTFGITRFRRRIDVLVRAEVLVAIENKLDSLEQKDQVKDYLEHLQHETGDRRYCLIYLTPNGRLPESLNPEEIQQFQGRTLFCWGYQEQLRAWLEKCRQECEAQRIRDFLSDFIAYIDIDLKCDLASNQKEPIHDD